MESPIKCNNIMTRSLSGSLGLKEKEKDVGKMMKQVQELYEFDIDAIYSTSELTELAHAEQAAFAAVKDEASDDEIVAALLHDIGWKVIHQVDKTGKFSSSIKGLKEVMGTFHCGEGHLAHDKIGEEYLRRIGFSERVCQLVGGHVAAKRYLTATDPTYYNRLSPSSKETLVLQGGPMDEGEVKKFEANPNHKGIVKLRTWDEAAKVAGLKVPKFSSYIPMMKRVWLDS